MEFGLNDTMNNLNSTFKIDISDKEFKKFCELIHNVAGIKLGENKKELLKNRLRKRLRALDIQSYKDYYNFVTKVDNSGTELSHMITAISTNVTHFFREGDHFTYLANNVLPEIYALGEQTGKRKFRVWSAGCSTGEEPYSIAITLHDFFKDKPGWDIKILATDISTNVIKFAKEGFYKMKALETIPKGMVSKHFHKVKNEDDEFIMVKDHLKSMVYVRHLNLMSETYPFKGPFDAIFCRNVMIYFDRPTQEMLLQRYYNYLAPHGYLFLGHSEGLVNKNVGFKYAAPATYSK